LHHIALERIVETVINEFDNITKAPSNDDVQEYIYS